MDEGAVMDDANGDFLPGSGATIPHQSSAVSREHTTAEGVVTHRLHLLSRRVYKKK
jgi:hypothetical protein